MCLNIVTVISIRCMCLRSTWPVCWWEYMEPPFDVWFSFLLNTCRVSDTPLHCQFEVPRSSFYIVFLPTSEILEYLIDITFVDKWVHPVENTWGVHKVHVVVIALKGCDWSWPPNIWEYEVDWLVRSFAGGWVSKKLNTIHLLENTQNTWLMNSQIQLNYIYSICLVTN